MFRERINCSNDSENGLKKLVKTRSGWGPRKNLSLELMMLSQFWDKVVGLDGDSNDMCWYGQFKDDRNK